MGFKKIITTILYHLFDMKNFGALHKVYNKIQSCHQGNGNCFQTDLSLYLRKWRFSEKLENNPLMSKKDIVKWSKKVNPSDIYSWVYTGGSYGEPLKLPYSKQRNLIRTATFRYYNEQGGYDLGDPFALIRAKNKSSILKYLRNETIIIPYDISTQSIAQTCNQLIERKIKTIIGYPTVLYEIALFIQSQPHYLKKLNIKNIISVSEMLTIEKRKVIHDVFQCNFIDRYSNEEVGLIAQQRTFGGVYFTNPFGLVVEVLDPISLNPTKEGEIGKVVVTDTTNELIPIIRYDTGDLAEVHEYNDKRLVSISRILGRVTETLRDSNGNPVSSLALGPCIYKPFSNAYYTSQFQLAQVEEQKYELRLVGKKVDFSPQVINTVSENLHTVLGKEINLIVSFVEEIPPQPSGKRPVYKYEI